MFIHTGVIAVVASAIAVGAYTVYIAKNRYGLSDIILGGIAILVGVGRIVFLLQ
jgi:hypothetical protein